MDKSSTSLKSRSSAGNASATSSNGTRDQHYLMPFLSLFRVTEGITEGQIGL